MRGEEKRIRLIVRVIEGWFNGLEAGGHGVPLIEVIV